MREARRGHQRVVSACIAAIALTAPVLESGLISLSRDAAPSATRSAPQVGIVLRERSPSSRLAEQLVRRAGGTVTRKLPIVDGFAARVPVSALPRLERSRPVAALWRDVRLSMADLDDGDDGDDDDESSALSPNTAWRSAVRLSSVPSRYDGDGVAVALLDTGVSSAVDLKNTVALRVEFTPGHDGFDRFGHGTHMAGIIAGNGSVSLGKWRGVAPDAQLISVKVAGPDGATDVSVVLAALQWVVANKDRLGIRVLNLAFGTDATSSYLTDPLDYAVERVWRAGILVVTAAGNRGPDAGTISKPGDDPLVLTVGAADVRGTSDRRDDVVAPFSSRGPTVDGVGKPDLVAPGTTIVSVRAVGSSADLVRPEARVRTAYFRGTGTSQAAAIVSGIAALMFEADPLLTPNEAKAALIGSSSGLQGQAGAGNGLVDAARAVNAVLARQYRGTEVNAHYAPATGLGELESSRGSYHVYGDPDGDGQPQLVKGEIDVLGKPWTPETWAAGTWSAQTWSAAPWHQYVGAFDALQAALWLGPTWSGMVNNADSWAARHWSDSTWAARHWSARHWSTYAWR
jgi:serine protease AprX